MSHFTPGSNQGPDTASREGHVRGASTLARGAIGWISASPALRLPLGCHQPTSVAALRLPEARGDLHKAVSEARFGHEPDYPPDWRKGCPTSAHVGHCLVYVDGRVKRLTEPEQDCNVIAWRRLTEPSKSSEEVDECESR